MDMGVFFEDKKIFFDVIINMWVEMYDFEDVIVFVVFVDLLNRNFFIFVKDLRYCM